MGPTKKPVKDIIWNYSNHAPLLFRPDISSHAAVPCSSMDFFIFSNWVLGQYRNQDLLNASVGLPNIRRNYL